MKTGKFLLFILLILSLSSMLFSCGKNEYKILYFDGNENKTVIVTEGELFALNGSFEKEGYNFVGFYDSEEGGKKYTNSKGSCLEAYSLESDLILYPRYEPKEYEIFLDYGEGIGTDSSFKILSDESIPPLPKDVKSKSGYAEFLGWYSGEELFNCSVLDKAARAYSDSSGKIYLTALFTTPNHTVTFYDSDGITKLRSESVAKGTKYSEILSEYTQNGKNILTWSESIGGAAADQNKVILSDMSFYPKDVSVTVTVDDGVNEQRSFTVFVGSSLTLTVPEKKGYSHTGWYDAYGNSYENTVFPTSSVSIFAKWQVNSYRVTLNTFDGSVDGEPFVSIEYGKNYKLPVATHQSRVFIGWSGTDGSLITDAYGNSLSPWLTDAQATVSAVYGGNVTLDTCPSSIVSTPVISTDVAVIYVGSDGSIPIPAATGYTFDGWYYNPDFSSISKVTDSNGVLLFAVAGYISDGKWTVGNDMTLYARWINNSYTVKYDPNCNLTGVQIKTTSHIYGKESEVLYSVYENLGHTFVEWNTHPDGSGRRVMGGGYIKDLATENGSEVTLYAIWKANSYLLNFTNPEGESIGTIPVKFGETITLPTPKHKYDGFYTFLYWKFYNDTYNGKYTHTYPHSVEFTAYWTQKFAGEYYITDKSHLSLIEKYPTATFHLLTDIELTDKWTPITNFKGVFHGHNHVINGLKISASTTSSGKYGFFAHVDGGHVYDLEFKSVSVAVSNSTNNSDIRLYAGAVAGYAQGGAYFRNIKVSGSVAVNGSKGGVSSVGGLVGKIEGVTFRDCISSATVRSAKGSANAGGIVGVAKGVSSTPTAFYNCSNSGSVNAENMVALGNARAAGIIGYAESGTITVNECSNTGSYNAKGTLGSHSTNALVNKG